MVMKESAAVYWLSALYCFATMVSIVMAGMAACMVKTLTERDEAGKTGVSANTASGQTRYRPTRPQTISFSKRNSRREMRPTSMPMKSSDSGVVMFPV